MWVKRRVGFGFDHTSERIFGPEEHVANNNVCHRAVTALPQPGLTFEDGCRLDEDGQRRSRVRSIEPAKVQCIQQILRTGQFLHASAKTGNAHLEVSHVAQSRRGL